MTIDQLRKAVRNTPFKPFRVSLADGRQFDVSRPEVVSIGPEAARTFVVAGRGEDYSIVDRLMVVSLDYGNGAKPRRRQAP